jgi:anti-sigma B factor antagonist
MATDDLIVVPPGGLRVQVRRQGQDVVLQGRLDSRTAPVARSLLHAAAEGGAGDLVVRLEDVEIWDASGLGVLVGANRKARQCGRRLVLADVPPRQLWLLRATRLSRALTVEPLAS